MKANTKTGKSERNLGVIAAVGAAGFFMLVIGWFVLRGSPSVATAGAGGAGSPPPDSVPDITDIEGTGNLDLDLTAKDDPTRLVATLHAEAFEPVGINERAVERPRVWVFLEDGRFGLVEARRGRFFMPTPGAAPESGMLSGEPDEPVRLRLFEATGDGNKPDPATAEPLLTAEFTDPLEFDMRHARVSSTGKFRVFSTEIEFRGAHLTAMLNQVQQRLELVEVRQGESITYTPMDEAERREAERRRAGGTLAGGSDDRGRAPRGAAARGTPGRTAVDRPRGVRERPEPGVEPAVVQADPAAEGAGEAGPKTDYYRAIFTDGVKVTHGTRTVTADALDMWVRMVGNALPEGAIAELQFAGGNDDREERRNPGDRASERVAAGSGEALPATTVAVASADEDPVMAALMGGSAPADADASRGADAGAGPTAARDAQAPRPGRERTGPEPVVLTWTGPLLIRPLPEEQPAELSRDDLRLRLTAERSGLVDFVDGESGLNVQSVSMDYGFTSTEVIHSGPGGNVELTMPGSGSFTGSRVMTNLQAGTVHVRGPGVMNVDAGSQGEGGQRIRWTEQADFDFEVTDARLTSNLDRASFAGGVQATDGDATLDGSLVTAVFVPTADGGRRLAQLDVQQAKADDGRGGRLTADAVRVDFSEGSLGNEIDPSRLVATGNVRGGQDGSSITAGEVTADLERQLDGDVAVSSVLARTDAQYTGADGTFAAGDVIEADAVGEVITLRSAADGTPARVGQHGTAISGPEILVDGRNRRARVIGAGTFEHTGTGQVPSEGPADVLATWGEGMSFDDYAGRVEAFGAASVVSKPDPLTRDTVNAQRVLVELTPWAGDPAGSEGGQERRLVRATALGSLGQDGAVSPASVESRVYSVEDAERVEQLFYLEGMQIVADNESQRLTVPEAGKLLILDRRRNGTAGPEAEGGLLAELANAGPGLTRFEWRGGMTMDRRDGTSTMRRTVRVNHKSLLAGSATELHCEKLTAQIRERTATGSPDAVKGELTQAEAAGAVYFKSGDRELIADRLLYDAVNGRAIATAAPGNLVSLFDAERATPVSSRALSWDLVRDRIEIERPSPVVTPGNLP